MKNRAYLLSFFLVMALLVSCGSPQKNAVTNDSNKFSATVIVRHYMEIKDALSADDGEKAAQSGGALAAALETMEKGTVPADRQEDYDDIMSDIMMNAEHIRNNAVRIAHLREHLQFLSRDLIDLLDLFTVPETLYQMRCNDFNDGKGADWLSTSPDDFNPYLGGNTRACSELIREIE